MINSNELPVVVNVALQCEKPPTPTCTKEDEEIDILEAVDGPPDGMAANKDVMILRVQRNVLISSIILREMEMIYICPR